MYQEEIENIFTAFLIEEGASHKTQKNYLADLRDFLQFTLSEDAQRIQRTNKEFLAEITQKDIHSYIAYLTRENKSQATITRRLSTLRTFFKGCIRQGVLAGSPIKLPDTTAKIDKSLHPVLKIWQIQRLKIHNDTQEAHHVNDFLEWILEQKAIRN